MGNTFSSQASHDLKQILPKASELLLIQDREGLEFLLYDLHKNPKKYGVYEVDPKQNPDWVYARNFVLDALANLTESHQTPSTPPAQIKMDRHTWLLVLSQRAESYRENLKNPNFNDPAGLQEIFRDLSLFKKNNADESLTALIDKSYVILEKAQTDSLTRSLAQIRLKA